MQKSIQHVHLLDYQWRKYIGNCKISAILVMPQRVYFTRFYAVVYCAYICILCFVRKWQNKTDQYGFRQQYMYDDYKSDCIIVDLFLTSPANNLIIFTSHKRHGVSNLRQLDCLSTSKLRISGPFCGESTWHPFRRHEWITTSHAIHTM